MHIIILKYRVPFSDFDFGDAPVSFIKNDGTVWDMSEETYLAIPGITANISPFKMDETELIRINDDPFRYRGVMGQDFKWINEHGENPTVEYMNFTVEV